MLDINAVRLSKRAKRDLDAIPKHIVIKLMAWVASVEDSGLSQTRRIPGYHDEPLKASRQGQRSNRLNRSYRAIYEVSANNSIEFVLIEEVNKHDY
jgi:proteic killer suppression protein